MRKSKLAAYLFIASEAFFFLALIIAYIYYSHIDGKLSESSKYLDVIKTSIFTLFLLFSSLTIVFAESKLKQGKKNIVLSLISATIVLGVIFLVGQILEYRRLFSVNLTISRNVFGSSFFALTGFHGLHVMIGIIVLSLIFLLIYSGKFRKIESSAFAAVSIYWHFVDAVWIVVFSVVYLGAIL